MSEQHPQYEALEYSEARLNQFIRRATDRRNLPPELRPASNVNKSAFVDGLIGVWSDAIESKFKAAEDNDESLSEKNAVEHEQDMERLDFTIKFLQGVLYSDLHHDNTHNEQLKKEGITDYALKIARDGARLFIETEKEKVTTSIAPEAKYESGLKILSDFSNLNRVIIDMYEQNRIKGNEAKAYIYFFDLQEASGSVEAKNAVKLIARKELSNMIKHASQNPNLFSIDGFKDPYVKTGIDYINLMIGNPLRKIKGLDTSRLISYILMNNPECTDEEVAKQHALSHIGYALNTLYPSD